MYLVNNRLHSTELSIQRCDQSRGRRRRRRRVANSGVRRGVWFGEGEGSCSGSGRGDGQANSGGEAGDRGHQTWSNQLLPWGGRT